MAAKADAFALDTSEFDISTKVSLDIHSNTPIPPGAAGIDAPMLVTPVRNIEAIKATYMFGKTSSNPKLNEVKWNKVASDIHTGTDKHKSCPMLFQSFSDFRPSSAFVMTLIMRVFILDGNGLVKSCSKYSTFCRENAAKTNMENNNKKGKTIIETNTLGCILRI